MLYPLTDSLFLNGLLPFERFFLPLEQIFLSLNEFFYSLNGFFST